MKQRIIKGIILLFCACFILMPAAAGAAAVVQAQKQDTSRKVRVRNDDRKPVVKTGKRRVTPARTLAPSERIKADQAVDFPADI